MELLFLRETKKKYVVVRVLHIRKHTSSILMTHTHNTFHISSSPPPSRSSVSFHHHHHRRFIASHQSSMKLIPTIIIHHYQPSSSSSSSSFIFFYRVDVANLQKSRMTDARRRMNALVIREGYRLSDRLTTKTLERLQKRCGEIDVYDLEAGRIDISKDGTFVSIAETSAFKKAAHKKLLNVPLILWDKSVGLKPSPFKRIYKVFCEIMPNHTLRVNSVKQMYRKIRSKYVHVKSVTKNKERTTMELIERLQKKTSDLKNRMNDEQNRVHIDWNDRITITSEEKTKTTTSNNNSSPKVPVKPRKKAVKPGRSLRAIGKQLSKKVRIKLKKKNRFMLSSKFSKQSSNASLSSIMSTSSVLQDTHHKSLGMQLDRLRHRCESPRFDAEERPATVKGGGSSTKPKGIGAKINVNQRNSEDPREIYKRLFDLAKRHATRSAEHTPYQDNEVTNEFPLHDLCLHVLNKTSCVREPRVFRAYFLSDSSVNILRSAFWLCHLKYFRRHDLNSQRQQQVLMETITNCYVRILKGPCMSKNESSILRDHRDRHAAMKPEDIDVVSKSKDGVFRVFPFAVRPLLSLSPLIFYTQTHSHLLYKLQSK